MAMKYDVDWMSEFVCPNANEGKFCVCQRCKNGKETFLLPEDIEKIQQDARQATIEECDKKVTLLIQDQCDFEDELIKLLNVRPRKDSHDGADSDRIIERCKELIALITPQNKEKEG